MGYINLHCHSTVGLCTSEATTLWRHTNPFITGIVIREKQRTHDGAGRRGAADGDGGHAAAAAAVIQPRVKWSPRNQQLICILHVRRTAKAQLHQSHDNWVDFKLSSHNNWVDLKLSSAQFVRCEQAFSVKISARDRYAGCRQWKGGCLRTEKVKVAHTRLPSVGFRS